MNYQKVRDYCHYTSKYRGAAHSFCNLKFNMPNEIPIVFWSRFKLWLSFYHYISSKQGWGEFWISWGNYRKVQSLLWSSRKRNHKNL